MNEYWHARERNQIEYCICHSDNDIVRSVVSVRPFDKV